MAASFRASLEPAGNVRRVHVNLDDLKQPGKPVLAPETPELQQIMLAFFYCVQERKQGSDMSRDVPAFFSRDLNDTLQGAKAARSTADAISHVADGVRPGLVGIGDVITVGEVASKLHAGNLGDAALTTADAGIMKAADYYSFGAVSAVSGVTRALPRGVGYLLDENLFEPCLDCMVSLLIVLEKSPQYANAIEILRNRNVLHGKKKSTYMYPYQTYNEVTQREEDDVGICWTTGRGLFFDDRNDVKAIGVAEQAMEDGAFFSRRLGETFGGMISSPLTTISQSRPTNAIDELLAPPIREGLTDFWAYRLARAFPEPETLPEPLPVTNQRSAEQKLQSKMKKREARVQKCCQKCKGFCSPVRGICWEKPKKKSYIQCADGAPAP